MPITEADILLKLSINTGPGDSTPQPDPNDSLGRFMSSTELADSTLNNLFDDVSGDENQAEESEYRCIFVHNSHASIAWPDVRVWILSQVSGGAAVAIGLDPTGNVASDSGVAQTVARPSTENAAPSGVTFSTPAIKASGLSIGSLGPGEARAIWVRRTAENSEALNNDGAVIIVEGDIGA